MIKFASALSASRNLVAFYNANTAGAQVKKFSDRKTAERRCALLAEELEAEKFDEDDILTAILEGSALENTAEVAAALAEQTVIGGFTHCPHCGVHLDNGYQTYDNLSADGNKIAKTMKHEYMCLGCGETFGPELKLKAKKPSITTGKLRPAMAESLKLDRQIKDETTGIVYKNACQVWKANLVTSSQGDRLSAVLYGEAKKGNRLASITINGHVFTLAVK